MTLKFECKTCCGKNATDTTKVSPKYLEKHILDLNHVSRLFDRLRKLNKAPAWTAMTLHRRSSFVALKNRAKNQELFWWLDWNPPGASDLSLNAPYISTPYGTILRLAEATMPSTSSEGESSSSLSSPPTSREQSPDPANPDSITSDTDTSRNSDFDDDAAILETPNGSEPRDPNGLQHPATDQSDSEDCMQVETGEVLLLPGDCHGQKQLDIHNSDQRQKRAKQAEQVYKDREVNA